MVQNIISVAVLIAATLLALSDILVRAAEEDVPSLSPDTFAEAIKGDLTLVKFFAPWCGHCKTMKTDYEDAAAALKGKAVLAEVDATVHKDLAEQYGIKGFPTIKLFSQGEELSEYKGARDKDSFVKYIERATLPSVQALSDHTAVQQFLNDNAGKVVYISTKLDKLAAAFKKQSMSMRDSMPDGVAFASVEDPALLKTAAAIEKDEEEEEATTIGSGETVLVIREDGSTDLFTGDETALPTFVKMSSIPLVGELSRDNAEIYTELGIPIALVFQDPKEKDEELLEKVRQVALKHRPANKLAFAWVDAVELKVFMDHLGIGDKNPAIAIYDFSSDAKYAYDAKHTEKNLNKFFDDFVAGKLEPTRRSEPIPDKNDEPVKVVVGDSWATIVENETKDVLIEQYAPWCGHCKALAPVLDTVAKALKDGGVDTLVIAKMDATANDPPAEYKAKSFPTIHFFPAGGKEALSYDGGRTKEDFIKYFTEHATHKFEPPTFPEEEEPVEDKIVETAEEETVGGETEEKDEL